jgi:mannosyltransferase OCH1-like enzyme
MYSDLCKIFSMFSMLYSCCIYANSVEQDQNVWHYVAFDTAMQRTRYVKEIEVLTEPTVHVSGIILYDFLKSLYEKNNPTILQNTIVKIPKIIHQIWIGSPVPDVYKAFMQTWIDAHCGNGWEYKLWTDENIHEIDLYNQKFYDDTENFGVKSDLLRWEILYKYGGMYVDIDYECLRPFDLFHQLYDFYTGVQPLDSGMLQLNNALIGSIPGHPILKHCIETIKDHWHLKGAPKKTGPVHFTQSFYATAGRNGTIDIALPSLYLYPLGCKEKVTDELQNSELHRTWIEQGSFAIHWWSKSWMPKVYRPFKFRSIDNVASSARWND